MLSIYSVPSSALGATRKVYPQQIRGVATVQAGNMVAALDASPGTLLQ